MNKIFYGIILAIVIFGGSGAWYVKNSPTSAYNERYQTSESSGQDSTASSTGAGTGGMEKSFTMTDVAAHNSEVSCYSVIRGDVYDLTSWIDKHPGGREKILGLCGKDGTSAFEKKHGGKDGPENTLTTFKIGVLTQ